MGGVYGVSPVMVSVVGQLGQAVELRPGQHYSGTVQASGDNLSVQIGTHNVPIEPVAGIQAGQHVDLELVEGRNGPKLRLTPRAAPQPSTTPPAQQGGIWSVLTAALESLNALGAVETARQLPPAFLPPKQGPLEQLLLLFLNRGRLGPDLQRVSSLVTQAANGGALSQQQASAFTALVDGLLVSGASGLVDALRRLTLTVGRSPEARLAAAINHGSVDELLKSLRQDAQTELARMRNDAALARFLREAGAHHEFQQTVDRVLNRLASAQLQNLRAFELPYLFMELAFGERSGLGAGQIHLFGEGAGAANRFDGQNATVVFDLTAGRLGDMWVTLSIVRGHCNCWFRVVESNVLHELERAAPSLKEGLIGAGYPSAHVQVTLWDGDRLKEAAALMRRFSRLNLQA